MDDADWISWRWVAGSAVALLIVGAGLFGYGDPRWVPVPLLGALVPPRLTDRRPGISIGVLLVQNLPALALLVVVVRQLRTGDELSDLTVVAMSLGLVVAGLSHAAWIATRHGRGWVAAAGVAVGASCATLAVSGCLVSMDEGYFVVGALLLLAADLAATPSPAWRDNTTILPTLAVGAFLLVISSETIWAGGDLGQGIVVLLTTVIAVAVTWKAKRGARQEEGTLLRT